MLPDGEPGCGRGERAFARRVAGGAVAHDASYWCPIQLSGPPGAVRAVLHQVVDPADAAAIAQQCGGQRGWERQAVLHHAGRFPGAAISPAQVMHLPAAAIEGPSSGVLLCVWVHGAASAEAHGALVQAAASVEGAGVQVLDLRRLEVRGSGASLAIASIVEGYGSAALPAALRGLQPGGAAHLVLPDPRLSKAVEMGEERASVLEGLPPPTALRLLQPNVRAPLGEASVSALRQALRRSMLCLDTAAADDAEAEGAQQGEMLQRQVEQGATHFPALLVRQRTGKRCTFVCLLLPCTGESSLLLAVRLAGWSVVLPAGWALPVWQCLVFASCRAAGQREWRWLHTLQGAPFFPHDAPDTRAYASLAAQLGAEWQQEMAGRPKGKRVSSAALRAPDWQALAAPGLLDSSAAAAPSAHAAGAAIAAEPPPLDGYFVARSEATVAAALWGVAHGAQALSPPHAARPVGNALAAGTLRWRPRQAAPAGAELCLVQALLHPVKRGLVADAAEVCVVLGREADQTTQTCYLQPAGGQPPAPAGQEPPSTAAIDPAALRTIGFVCSPALHGMPRTAPSLAVCSAAALWRLRALQHYAPRRDRGALHAWLRNPGSAALFPVQLSLPIEHN